jgi:hypothetical protein
MTERSSVVLQVFQGNPFASLRTRHGQRRRRGSDPSSRTMILSEEAASKNMQTSFFNAQWASTCVRSSDPPRPITPTPSSTPWTITSLYGTQVLRQSLS